LSFKPSESKQNDIEHPERLFELNTQMQRDIFNRIKHARGARLKAKEITWMTDKVEAAF